MIQCGRSACAFNATYKTFVQLCSQANVFIRIHKHNLRHRVSTGTFRLRQLTYACAMVAFSTRKRYSFHQQRPTYVVCPHRYYMNYWFTSVVTLDLILWPDISGSTSCCDRFFLVRWRVCPISTPMKPPSTTSNLDEPPLTLVLL